MKQDVKLFDVVESISAEAASQLIDLSELDLALVGGGTGEVVIA